MRKGCKCWGSWAWNREDSGGFLPMCISLMKGNEEERTKLFSVVPSNRTRWKGQKLKHMKFQPSTIFFFFFKCDSEYDSFPREVMKSPSMKMLKGKLGARSWTAYCSWYAWAEGLNWMILWGAFQHYLFCDTVMKNWKSASVSSCI